LPTRPPMLLPRSDSFRPRRRTQRIVPRSLYHLHAVDLIGTPSGSNGTSSAILLLRATGPAARPRAHGSEHPPQPIGLRRSSRGRSTVAPVVAVSAGFGQYFSRAPLLSRCPEGIGDRTNRPMNGRGYNQLCYPLSIWEWLIRDECPAGVVPADNPCVAHKANSHRSQNFTRCRVERQRRPLSTPRHYGSDLRCSGAGLPVAELLNYRFFFSMRCILKATLSMPSIYRERGGLSSGSHNIYIRSVLEASGGSDSHG